MILRIMLYIKITNTILWNVCVVINLTASKRENLHEKKLLQLKNLHLILFCF